MALDRRACMKAARFSPGPFGLCFDKSGTAALREDILTAGSWAMAKSPDEAGRRLRVLRITYPARSNLHARTPVAWRLRSTRPDPQGPGNGEWSLAWIRKVITVAVASGLPLRSMPRLFSYPSRDRRPRSFANGVRSVTVGQAAGIRAWTSERAGTTVPR
jgi:hypothetical protein